MKKATILILKEKNARPITYIVDVMAENWTAAGHHVIHHFGPQNLPDADIIFLHVNQTIVPQEYADCISKYPKAINGTILDISRRRYSMVQIGPDDLYDGPVIVKTNNNYGGVAEAVGSSGGQRLKKRLNRLKIFKAAPGKTTSWRSASSLNPLEYPIFNSLYDVPSDVWGNNHLIVEKFIPERDGNLFFVRFWTFFGNQTLTGRFGSRHPIVKFHRCVTDITPVDIPAELVAWREKLNMDYGRFDYVMHNGSPVLLDVNKTQATGRLSEVFRKQFFDLSKGIDDYL
jgi:hypothetical protein